MDASTQAREAALPTAPTITNRMIEAA